jgi:L-iditol 2-dehydrogenase
VPINSNLVHYKQLIITGTTRASLTQYRKTLDFIAAGVIDVKRLVTGKFKLEDIKQGFALSTATKGLKNVVYFE